MAKEFRESYQGNTAPDKFHIGYGHKQALKDIEISHAPDGGIDITDHSIEEWQPTDRQSQFFEHLFDVESPGYLSLYNAVKQLDPPGTMTEVRRWCNKSVHFTVRLKELIKEKVDAATMGAELMVAGAAEGELHPERDQKWGIKMLLKMQEFAHAKEVRWIQINQQFNIGVNMDMSDEQLRKIIGENSPENTGAPSIIEGG